MGKFQDIPRYAIVRVRPDRGPLWRGALVLAWGLSLVLAWTLSSRHAVPQLPGMAAELDSLRTRAQQAESELEEARQLRTTAARSDQISRAANRQVQQQLAERDEEIAGLRADLAFYERMAGATGQPKGLNVHSAEFEPEAAGSWRYRIVLTQNLERGKVSAGQLRFAVEGVRGGKLVQLDWDELHQRKAPARDFSFRYFQQLKGSVMLPPDFTPQRVRVSLRGAGAPFDQALAWTQPTATGET